MGCTSSQIFYSEEHEIKSSGSTCVHRHPQAILKGRLFDSPDTGLVNLQDVLNKTLKDSPDKPYLYTRNKKTGTYESKTFREVYDISQKLGSGLINLELVTEVEGYSKECPNLKIIGVFSKNREEWLMLEYANIHFGFTMVPFYDTLGLDTIPYVINHTELTTVFCSADTAATIAKLYEHTTLKNIVLLDEISQQLRDSLYRYNLFTFQEIIQSGSDKLHSQNTKYLSDLVLTFSYTSGTTGVPKAVMQTHKNYLSALAAVKYSDIEFTKNDVHLSYLPLPHSFERLMSICCLYFSTTIYFYGGDVLQLKQDIIDSKPTIFVSVPRLYNKFYNVIKEGMDKLTGFKKSLADKAVQTKLDNLKENATYTHSVYDSLVFSKIKPAFGGRVRVMVTGSAPISGEVINFLKVSACCPILEGYGQTETTAASFVTYKNDPESGHVGGPTVNTEFMLIDIPEMGYKTNDVDENGKKMPRGEILMRGPGIMPGYYKDPVKTKETIDEQGWLHTGDVGVLLSNGAVKIIDRRKNIFKLSQGEYIAPEKIENIYVRAKGVSEAFVYGDSLQSVLVAVIVPSKDYVEEFAKNNGLSGSFEQLCKEKQIINQIYNNIEEFGKAEKLLGFERVKKIHLDPVSFVISGCCTPSFKMKRHEAKLYYRSVIDTMYKEVS